MPEKLTCMNVLMNVEDTINKKLLFKLSMDGPM